MVRQLCGFISHLRQTPPPPPRPTFQISGLHPLLTPLPRYLSCLEIFYKSPLRPKPCWYWRYLVCFNWIQKIHLKHRALRTVMNDNHDRLIHKFPPEIASHIFIQYAPPSALLDNDSSPLYLGAACHKWRQLAWVTPRLWSLLLVGFRARGRNNCPNKFDRPQLICRWLECSANSLPLAIRFESERVLIDGVVYHEVREHGKCVL